MLLCLQTFAQDRPEEFAVLFAETTAIDTEDPSAWFQQVTSKLDKKSKKKPHLFLKNLFYTVQNKQLKHYKSYASFGELIEKGAYDCLTGTALYALLLTHYDIPYQIHETPFHINLTAQVDGKVYLLESTDPLTGFQELDEPFADSNIGLKELAGLLYFNQAVAMNNSENFQDAFIAASYAQLNYPSQRISSKRDIIEQNLIISVASAIEDR